MEHHHQHGNGMYSPVSTTSSSGSGASDSDEFGLRTLRCFYSPYLVSELERLFISSPLEQANMNGSHVKSVWDDFENNGQETELDELDRLFRGMDVGELCRKSAPDVAAAAAIDMSGIQKASSAVEDILTKASLIEILRERERLQRSRTKKLQKKPNANKVCVFCRNNGEAETVYTSHQLKDPEGNITCPILYIYTCPICGANGKSAHTIKYCPYNTGESLSTISTLSKAIRPVLPKHIVPLI